jgi:uncharacterized membrane protein
MVTNDISYMYRVCHLHLTPFSRLRIVLAAICNNKASFDSNTVTLEHSFIIRIIVQLSYKVVVLGQLILVTRVPLILWFIIQPLLLLLLLALTFFFFFFFFVLLFFWSPRLLLDLVGRHVRRERSEDTFV